MSRDLVFEIGCEEIPARLMPETIRSLKASAEEKLKAARLEFKEIAAYGTPRRLVLFVGDLAEESEPREYEVKGPPAQVAYTADGKPTRAAEGFAKSQGVPLESLTIRQVEGGSYVFAVKREEGRPAGEVLAEILPDLVRSLSFPRPMRWGSGELRFVRPIRWLLALFGTELVPFNLDGLKSDRFTYGHRFLAPGPFRIEDPADYFTKLEKAYVVLDPEERRARIRAQGEQLAKEVGGRALFPEDLLTEVTFLVEYPTALLGSFAPEYLELPSEVVVTPMKDHQRYFPVVDPEGNLLPYFIAVRNGTAEHLDVVRAGNEKVLRARLADARFFFEEDKRMPLADRVERLKHIVFQENLGTLYDKTERLEALAQYLAGAVGLDGAVGAFVVRAAHLAKADLTTNMVYEFPELQGIMGREYALLSGEHASVAQAIAEQYLPRFAGDELPVTIAGSLLALADKMDTIVGCFGVGLVPTGSQDPYGLRRLASGCISIMLEGELDLSLGEVISTAAGLYERQNLLPRPAAEVAREVREFLVGRLRIALEDRGLRYDVVDAVLAAAPDNPGLAYRRAETLQRLRQEPFFRQLLTAFTRVANLARQAGGEELKPDLFTEAAEKELYDHYQKAATRLPALVDEERYREALVLLAELAPSVDRFFEEVLVMAPDPAVRANRLALLKAIRNLGLSIADFSRLVED
ncbi:MAG: glycyl-tRNA synthetase beta chain [Bacillota bacterium]|jgi:glycyl-tRNA synthetase beta chain|nr:glycyl-tRNA synthetase beta chain [Bacillota bacterium]MDK2924334.1 glycyl-tRNA synthetase beta chain [Bacillota bacterium]